MGGTSTDVSHFDGDSVADCERAFDTLVAGVRLRAPMMAIHTIAAGGGSILHFDGQRFRVGPDSAGADPGPACYRRGGPLTVTDCNVLLGRIQPDFFPAVFGRAADSPLDAERVRAEFTALAEQVERATRAPATPEQVAEGFLQIAVSNMAGAIKVISVQRGHDVTEYTLACFGGAGGGHACRVADELGIRRVFLHPFAGVLSALGMGLADVGALRERAFERTLDEAVLVPMQRELDALAALAAREVEAQGVPAARIEQRRRVHLKYAGTDTTLVADAADVAGLRDAFEALYRTIFGFTMPEREIVFD
jgi:5-oxoprolinase (ATP-hydrolysing)